MVIVETPIFTRRVQELLSDDDYLSLQRELVVRPDSGDLIPRTGGLRKVRVALPGRGKRDGARVIYYWITKEQQILMLYIYAKAEQDDLTHDQLRALCRVVSEELRDG